MAKKNKPNTAPLHEEKENIDGFFDLTLIRDAVQEYHLRIKLTI